MKKKLKLLWLLAMCLVLSSCSQKDKPKSSTKSFSQTDVQQESTTIKKDDVKPVTLLDCIPSEYQITNLTYVKNSTVAVETADRSYMASDDSSTYIFMVDILNNTILSKTELPHGESVVGVRKDGTIITLNYDKNYYSTFDTSGNSTILSPYDNELFLYDSQNECIYEMAKRQLNKIDKNGASSLIYEFDTPVDIKAYAPSQGYVAINYDADNDSSGHDFSIYSIKSKKDEFTIKDSYGFCVPVKNGIAIMDSYQSDNSDDEDHLKISLTYVSYNDLNNFKCYECPVLSSPVFMDNSCFVLLPEMDEGINYITKGTLFDMATGMAYDMSEYVKDASYCNCVYAKDADLYIMASVYTGENSKNMLYAISPKDIKEYNVWENEMPVKKAPTVYTAGDALSSIRQAADYVEDKHNVSILIGNECHNAKENLKYSCVSTEESVYQYSIEEYNELYKDGLQCLDDVLSTFPDGFLEKFKNHNGEGGLRFIVVSHLENKSGDFSAAGITYKYGAWYNIVLNINYFSSSATIQHEMWHAVEELIKQYDPYAFSPEIWNIYNPQNFSYHEDFETYDNNENVKKYLMMESENAYFTEIYSTVTDMEDRATIIEFLYSIYPTDNANALKENYEYLKNYPALMAKLHYMEEMVKNLFGNVYWLEMMNK